MMTNIAVYLLSKAPFIFAQAQTQPCEKPMFMGLVPWYQYLPLGRDIAGNCTITGISDTNIWTHLVIPIGLAILDDLLRITALVAVGYVIYGGIKYIMSQGSPDGINNAQNTIINALIGLVISMISVGVVTFIGRQIG